MNIEQQQQRHKKARDEVEPQVGPNWDKKQTNKQEENKHDKEKTTARRGQVSWLEAKDFFSSGDQDKHINKKIRKQIQQR